MYSWCHGMWAGVSAYGGSVRHLVGCLVAVMSLMCVFDLSFHQFALFGISALLFGFGRSSMGVVHSLDTGVAVSLQPLSPLGKGGRGGMRPCPHFCPPGDPSMFPFLHDAARDHIPSHSHVWRFSKLVHRS